MAGWKIQARIEGIEQLRKLLRALPASIARKALRPALVAEGARIVKEGKSRVPILSGQFKKSLGKKAKTYVKTNTIVVVVGPRRGFRTVYKGKPWDPSFYAHLVEFGVKPHMVGRHKFGQRLVLSRRTANYVPRMHPGFQPRLPLTKAWQMATQGAVPRMRARIGEEIDKMVARGMITSPGGEGEASDA